jgi:imidazolonepropionase-like amidohydrolase
MKRTWKILIIGIAILAIAPVYNLKLHNDGRADEELHLTSDNVVAFVHVNVIPMDRERVLFDQTVIIQAGHIREIGPALSTRVKTGATIIDAKGQYLMPALSDMHVHLLGQTWNIMFPPEAQFAANELDFNKLLFLFVTNGVATVQVMSAFPEHITIREQIRRGEILGPRLILARMVDGPGRAWPPPLSDWVATAAEARQAVLDAKETGYDKIKAYSFLSQECYDSIIATAEEVSMPVDGHVPMDLSVEYILDAGQNLIAHAEEVKKHARGNYTQDRVDYYAKIIADSNTWITPTLIMKRNLLAMFNDVDRELARPEVRYLHPMGQGVWSFLIQNNYMSMPQEHQRALKDEFEMFERPFTKALHDQGVKLMTGTDSLVPTTMPGFSIHRELEELVDIGLTPYEALRASTTHPIIFLGELEEAGTVSVGKRADLILLEENPLEEITHSRKIEGVMIQGRWLSKREIQEGLEEVLAFYETIKK